MNTISAPPSKRIGEGALAESMTFVSAAVEKVSATRKEEDDLTSIAPEKYLDPLLSVLMRDPVTLPTSGVSQGRLKIWSLPFICKICKRNQLF